VGVVTAQQVGIREIRQNLSKYLKRVEEGETFEVTDHGRPVAVLSPVSTSRQPRLERLAREGWIILGTGEDVTEMGDPLPYDGPPTADVLDDLRRDRV